MNVGNLQKRSPWNPGRLRVPAGLYPSAGGALRRTSQLVIAYNRCQAWRGCLARAVVAMVYVAITGAPYAS